MPLDIPHHGTIWHNIFMAAPQTHHAEKQVSTVKIEMRFRLPLIFLAILLAGAFLLPDQVWNTLLIGFGGLYLAAFIWAALLSRGLHANRRLRFGWVAVGDRLSEEFVISNYGELPASWVEVIDESNVPGYKAAVVRSVGARSSDRWRESAVSLRRGLFHLGPWAIRSGDPTGIFIITRTYHHKQEIIIHPPIHGKLPIPLPLGESSGRVRARRRSWQATTNAASIRDYEINDPVNHIHWPSSARRGKLMTRQFDLDAAGDIWILIDMQANEQLGQGASSTEEHAVLLAASLAARAGRQNRAVGLAVYGQEPQIIPPARGEGQQWKILRVLALIGADGQTPIQSALRDLSQIATKGAAAIIITPNLSMDWLPDLSTLAKSGIQSNVTLLDRTTFGGQGSVRALRDAVRQLGFSAHIVRQGDVGQPLQEREGRGFWQFKVTGTGRAIAISKPEIEERQP